MPTLYNTLRVFTNAMRLRALPCSPYTVRRLAIHYPRRASTQLDGIFDVPLSALAVVRFSIRRPYNSSHTVTDAGCNETVLRPCLTTQCSTLAAQRSAEPSRRITLQDSALTGLDRARRCPSVASLVLSSPWRYATLLNRHLTKRNNTSPCHHHA
jgi:hypothetical protein